MINRRSEGAWLVFVGNVTVEKLAGNVEHVLLGVDRVRRLCKADEPLAAIIRVIRPCVWCG